jgi:tetratricopeptide (TPR) repeat protein
MLSNQSLALMANGQLDHAGKKLLKAIELDPNYGHAHFNLGVLRYRQRNYGEAVEHFRDALSTNPALTQTYLNLGTTYAAMGKFQAAIDVWKQFERIQPNNASLVFNICLGWLRLGQDAKASSALRKAFDLEPNNKQIATTLIKLLATSQRHSVRDVLQAITFAERLYTSRPRDPVVADLLAIAFAANGNFDRAVRYSEIALEFGKADRKFANEVRARLERYRRKVTF